MQADITARWRVIETARSLSSSGLSPGRSGNVSVRHGVGMLITPTGMFYENMRADDVVFVDLDGHVGQNQRRPSSEWRFHLDIYRSRPEVGGIVHCHSRHATALACAGMSIPAFHYMVAVVGGTQIPLAAYALFGTQELSDNVVNALQGYKATLMEHHGQIALGADVGTALELAHEVEELAAQYVLTRALGSQRVLHADQMASVVEKFRSYGRQDEKELENSEEA